MTRFRVFWFLMISGLSCVIKQGSGDVWEIMDKKLSDRYKQGNPHVMVDFKNRNISIAMEVAKEGKEKGWDKGKIRFELMTRLKKSASKDQGIMMAFLEEMMPKGEIHRVKPYWIRNCLCIMKSTPWDVMPMAHIFKNRISAIYEMPKASIHPVDINRRGWRRLPIPFKTWRRRKFRGQKDKSKLRRQKIKQKHKKVVSKEDVIESKESEETLEEIDQYEDEDEDDFDDDEFADDEFDDEEDDEELMKEISEEYDEMVEDNNKPKNVNSKNEEKKNDVGTKENPIIKIGNGNDTKGNDTIQEGKAKKSFFIRRHGDPPPYGLDQIGAWHAHSMGLRGQGITIGVIDSGCNFRHEALEDNYVGDYGWACFLAEGIPSDETMCKEVMPSLPVDFDTEGHGTHVAGTAVGGFNVGVAPESQWMACAACQDDGCFYSDLIKCSEFMLCPWIVKDGTRLYNCSKAPDILNNSWGAPTGNSVFDEVSEVLKAGGLIPIHAIGNSGPDCQSLMSPADHPITISVGATGFFGNIAEFSSRGDSQRFGVIKPELVAPGDSILSADANHEFGYKFLTGTSMSTPHVVGALAVLATRCRNILDYIMDHKHTILPQMTVLLQPTSGTCDGNTTSTPIMDNVQGYGVIHIGKALDYLGDCVEYAKDFDF